MNSETPKITTSQYASNAINPFQNQGLGMQLGQVTFGGGAGIWERQFQPQQFIEELNKKTTETTMSNPNRRIVQVFIADTNDNVPLDQSVLFQGEQKLTDLTDTELFFEVPIAETLKAHNEKRVKWLDKEASKRAGKDVTLDPVKIRDLKMVVVTVAQF